MSLDTYSLQFPFNVLSSVGPVESEPGGQRNEHAWRLIAGINQTQRRYHGLGIVEVPVSRAALPSLKRLIATGKRPFLSCYLLLRERLCNSGSAKYEKRVYRSNTQPFGAQSAQCHIECILCQS